MAVLLTVLKILVILLSVLLAMVITGLLLPLGFAIEYRPDRFRVSAVYGPFRRTVWSHRMHRQKKKPKPLGKVTGTETSVEAGRGPAETVKPQEPAVQETTSVSPPAKRAGADTVPQQEEEEEELPSGAMGRLERMFLLLEENPKALARCILGHVRWLHRHSVFKMSIRHADIFWTVTCEDASRTAIVYGAEMAALNTALALVQQTVRLQSDRLQLEPDFTGNRRAERKIACTVSASAILMLHLLYRIWKDPLLQPEKELEPQS